MKISRNTRPARAGIKMGKAIIEIVHLMYLNPHALEFLNTFIETVNQEFERRKKEFESENRIGKKRDIV